MAAAEREAGVGTFHLDLHRHQATWSPGCAAILGIEAGGPHPLETWFDLVDRPDLPRVLQHFAGTIGDDGAGRCEFRVVRPDGAVRVVRTSATWVWNADGTPAHVRGVIQDGTDMRETLDALSASEARHRAILEALPDLLFTLTSDGTFLDCHVPAGAHLLLPPDAFLGRRAQDVVPSPVRELCADATARALATGLPQRCEYAVAAGREVRHYEMRVARCGLDRIVALCRDITERKQHEDALRASEERFELAVHGSASGIWDWADVRLRALWCSPYLCELLGEDAATGTATLDWLHVRLHPDDRRRCARALLAHFERNRPFDVDCRLRHRSGEYRWFRLKGRALRDASGVPTRMAGSLTDVTQGRLDRDRLERQAADLARARDEALAATRAKASFLAMMSHEIRTPLNGLLGMTSLLLDSDLPPEQREYVELQQRSGESLLAVINDILDFSKIEAGKLTLDVVDFDPGGVVEDVVELLAETAHRKHLELTALIDPTLPRCVGGDPGRLRQVLTNLVANAVKFTDAGEVAVEATVDSTAAEAVVLRFEVRDSGVGIPLDAQPRLFQAFSQVDDSSTRRFGGTGLGLAICRQLAELMGGSIGVASREGIGSTFWFTVRAEHRAAPDPAPREPDLSGRHVLVVDDNASSRRRLQEELRHHGARLVLATDQQSALAAHRSAAARHDGFDTVLLDWTLPGLNGLQLGRELLAQGCQAHLLLLAPASLRAQTSAALAAGFAGQLCKPLRRGQLGATLASLASPTPRASALDPVRPVGGQPPPAIRQPRILLVEDHPIGQQVARRLLEKLGYAVEIAANGGEALEAVRRTTYDLILMDCYLPTIDGYEVTRRIRTGEAGGRRVPIVAFTAAAMRGDRERCLDAGMDDYLTKPVRADAFAATIARWLAQDPPGASSPEAGPPIDGADAA